MLSSSSSDIVLVVIVGNGGDGVGISVDGDDPLVGVSLLREPWSLVQSRSSACSLSGDVVFIVTSSSSSVFSAFTVGRADGEVEAEDEEVRGRRKGVRKRRLFGAEEEEEDVEESFGCDFSTSSVFTFDVEGTFLFFKNNLSKVGVSGVHLVSWARRDLVFFGGEGSYLLNNLSLHLHLLSCFSHCFAFRLLGPLLGCLPSTTENANRLIEGILCFFNSFYSYL